MKIMTCQHETQIIIRSRTDVCGPPYTAESPTDWVVPKKDSFNFRLVFDSLAKLGLK